MVPGIIRLKPGHYKASLNPIDLFLCDGKKLAKVIGPGWIRQIITFPGSRQEFSV